MARDTITAKPWTVTVTPTDIRLRHHTHRHDLSFTDMLSAMPIWAPAIIRAALAEIEALQEEALKSVSARSTLPPESAPRDGTQVDIYVSAAPAGKKAYRIADAYYLNSATPSTAGWYTTHNGASQLTVPDSGHLTLMGWTPIPRYEA